MKGYIGFKNGLINGEQKYIENTVIEDEAGIVFYRLPHHLVEHYDFAKDFEFAEVEALDEVHTDDNEKFVTTKLKIGKKISVAELCKRSVSEFFEAFEFDKKIEEAKQTANYGAANAGDYGTANAGDYGTANAGYCGAANAGDNGAANAGEGGVASAGMTKGVVVYVRSYDEDDEIEIKVLEHKTKPEEIGHSFSVKSKFFEPVREHKIVIAAD